MPCPPTTTLTPIMLRSLALEFLRREDGPTAVEYAVMLGFLFMVCFAAVATVGSDTDRSYRSHRLNRGVGGSPVGGSHHGSRRGH